MTSQPSLKRITIHILPSISRSKGNQTMKFGQVIEYNKRNIFFKNHAENEAGRVVSDLVLFFKNALYEVKAKGYQLSFNIFQQLSTWYIIKTYKQTVKTLDIQRYAQL